MKTMKSNLIKLAMTGLMIVASATMSVEARNRGFFSERQAYEIGERNGYEQGLREGREDWRRGRRYDDDINHTIRNGRFGYRQEYRYQDDYLRGFRRGYGAGYRTGYQSSRRR